MRSEFPAGPTRSAIARWTLYVVLLAVWAVGWLLAWQRVLFGRFLPEHGPLMVVFENEFGDGRTLWIAAIAGLALSVSGVVFLTFRAAFASHSTACSRIWLGAAVVLIAVGLAFPILFTSKSFVVVDQANATISFGSRWLYTEDAETLRFDELQRVNLRIRETEERVGTASKCLLATGLSLIRKEGPAVRLPTGYDHEGLARHVAEAADVQLDVHESRQC